MTTITDARFRGKANLKVEVEFSGTPAQFILLMEELGAELDSRDMGDAMGFLIYHLITECDFELEIHRPEFSLYAYAGNDLFQWESIPIDFNINLDSLPPTP